MKQTIRDKVIAGLKAQGWQPFPNASRRYVEFHHSDQAAHFFVGKRGALRIGTNITNSRSMEDTQIYRHLLQVGDTSSATGHSS